MFRPKMYPLWGLEFGTLPLSHYHTSFLSVRKWKKMADRIDGEFLPPRFLENNGRCSAQHYPKINRRSFEQTREYEDNLFLWKLMRSQDSLSLTVSCNLRA